MSGILGVLLALKASARATSYVVLGSTTAINGYPWTPGSGGGFGTKVTDPTNPNDLPLSADFSSTGADVALTPSFGSLGSIYAYPFTTGFGTRYSNAASPPTNAGAILFMPNDTTLLAGAQATPWIYAWPWTIGTGFGTKYADPGTLPPGQVNSVTAKPTSDYVFCCGQTSPYMDAYPFASGWGTKIADPGTLLASEARGIDYYSGDVLVSSFGTLRAYPFTTSWGTIYSAPSTDIGGLTARGVAFSRDGTLAAVCVNTAAPWFYVYDYTVGTGFGSRYTNSGTTPTGIARKCEFSSSKDVIVTHNTTPFVTAYPWSSGFGTKFSNPATLPPGDAWGIAFN